MTASYVLRINDQKACTMNGLRAGVEQASNCSTFIAPSSAWAPPLSDRRLLQRIAGRLGVRDYLSLAELREAYVTLRPLLLRA